MNTESILQERAKTHGAYQAKAQFIQELKDSMRQTPNWLEGELRDFEKEALDCIALKLGRILFGDHGNEDHWRDIGGYAALGGGWAR